jgi:hypothetical protein
MYLWKWEKHLEKSIKVNCCCCQISAARAIF